MWLEAAGPAVSAARQAAHAAHPALRWYQALWSWSQPIWAWNGWAAVAAFGSILAGTATLGTLWFFWPVGGAEPTWRRSKVFHVTPGIGRRFRDNDLSLSLPGNLILTPLWDYGQLNENGAQEVADVHALFCQDETGTNLYRFIDGRVGYDVWQANDQERLRVTYLRQAFSALRQ